LELLKDITQGSPKSRDKGLDGVSFKTKQINGSRDQNWGLCCMLKSKKNEFQELFVLRFGKIAIAFN